MEFLIVGTRAVRANLFNTSAIIDIIDNMEDCFAKNKIADVNEFIGILHEVR